MAMRDVRTHSGGVQTSLRRSASRGLGYAWHNRLILYLLILSAVAAVLGVPIRTCYPYSPGISGTPGLPVMDFLLSSAGGGALSEPRAGCHPSAQASWSPE